MAMTTSSSISVKAGLRGESDSPTHRAIERDPGLPVDFREAKSNFRITRTRYLHLTLTPVD